ncbi:MAG TPA: hypothetical protein QKA14_02215 [Candidatus Megaira endosymbiont of Hartmannula sinica]|nr:hypothetical protein [Candidatus Megaera endosymbiont of Hartmannula sinica]
MKNFIKDNFKKATNYLENELTKPLKNTLDKIAEQHPEILNATQNYIDKYAAKTIDKFQHITDKVEKGLENTEKRLETLAKEFQESPEDFISNAYNAIKDPF